MNLPWVERADQDGLLAAVTVSRIETFTRRYYGLFNDRRFDEAEALVHPEAVFSYPAAKEHFIGPAGYRELAQRWTAAFPDAELTITDVIVIGDIACTAWIGSGTHLGTLDIPGFPPIPPTMRAVQLPMCETIRVVDGMVVESRMVFDAEELRRRLGL
ncbi:MAG: ester cyclase [Acidobacteriota bacterium]|nr:ester cyclase [Acidobacteriota bacterium]